MTRIVVADDHAVVRQGLRTLLEAQSDFVVVGEAGTAAQAIERALAGTADLLTLDLSMAGWGGSAIEPVTNSGAKVLIYSMHDDPIYVRTAIASGARGYVLKSSPTVTLLDAIRTVVAGGTAIDPVLASATDVRSSGAGQLSRREREVLELLVRGLTHQAIADQIFVSVKTVETYCARIREKTGLKSRAELTHYGWNAGLLTPPPKSDAG